MSRTHSHKNYVGLFSGEKSPREIHDHRHGECDLPSRNRWEEMLKEVRHPYFLYNQYRCIWALSAIYYIKNRPCNCAFCLGTYDREVDNKRERRRGKRVFQNYDTILDDEEF